MFLSDIEPFRSLANSLPGSFAPERQKSKSQFIPKKLGPKKSRNA